MFPRPWSHVSSKFTCITYRCAYSHAQRYVLTSALKTTCMIFFFSPLPNRQTKAWTYGAHTQIGKHSDRQLFFTVCYFVLLKKSAPIFCLARLKLRQMSCFPSGVCIHRDIHVHFTVLYVCIVSEAMFDNACEWQHAHAYTAELGCCVWLSALAWWSQCGRVQSPLKIKDWGLEARALFVLLFSW